MPPDPTPPPTPERIVAEALSTMPPYSRRDRMGEYILAALRAAGYAIVRPDAGTLDATLEGFVRRAMLCAADESHGAESLITDQLVNYMTRFLEPIVAGREAAAVERCAKLMDQIADDYDRAGQSLSATVSAYGADQIRAAAIRQLKEPSR